MANGLFSRLFGKSKNNKKSQNKNSTVIKTSTPQPPPEPAVTKPSDKPIVSTTKQQQSKSIPDSVTSTLKPTELSMTKQKQVISPSPSPSSPLPPPQQQESVASRELLQSPLESTRNTPSPDIPLSLDLREKLVNTDQIVNDFTSPQQDVQLDNLLATHLYNLPHNNDEYHTVSSLASSHLSLQDALFSHLSSTTTLDSSFTIDTTKFKIETDDGQEKQKSLPASYQDPVEWERYFSEIYLDGLKCLTNDDVTEAFRLFEFVALEGQRRLLSKRLKVLVAFAQFRAGLMLWEIGKEAESLWRMGADNGNLRAIVGLGQLAVQEGRLEEAKELYYRARNLKAAKVAFGLLVLFQTQDLQRQSEAVELLTQASDQGHSLASLALSIHFAKDPERSLSYVRRIQSHDPLFAIAQYQAGYLYSATAQYALAHQSYNISASTYPPSLRKRAVLTLLGLGVRRDPRQAFALLTRAVQLGDAPSNILLGQLYQAGLGVQRDLTRAMLHFQGRDPLSRLSRALLLAPENPTFAYRECQQLVDEAQGDIQHECRLRLALWQYNGLDGLVEADPATSIATLRDLSERVQYPPSHYWYAWSFLPDHPQRAFEAFLRGGETRAECVYCVGLMAPDGLAYFRRAAQMGFPLAMTQVGAHYFAGRQVPRDLDQAFVWFEQAARLGETMAVQYVADYWVKGRAVDPALVRELWVSAVRQNDPVSLRMVALVALAGLDLTPHLDDSDLAEKYRAEGGGFRFGLVCLWRAVQLGDHASGKYLCEAHGRMQSEDMHKTLQVFESVETRVPNKMSLAYGMFLKTCDEKRSALKKFIEVATFNTMTTSVGWNARLEAAKAIVLNGWGKSRARHVVFTWLNEMVRFQGRNLFFPLVLLGKYHDEELCKGCDKTKAKEYFERSLEHTSKDLTLELDTRLRLVQIYYEAYQDDALGCQLDLIETKTASDSKYLADVYYYRGLFALHVKNDVEKAKNYLTQSHDRKHLMACLELGYLYGTLPDHEDAADACFQTIDQSTATTISFKNRLTETMVQMRPHNYPAELNKMRFAAGITHSVHGHQRQALHWLETIQQDPWARLTTLALDPTTDLDDLRTRVKEVRQAPNELDYYHRTALGLALLRLAHTDQTFAYDACQALQTLESYDLLAQSNEPSKDDNLFPILYNVVRNDPRAHYRLAQHYHQRDGLTARTAHHYLQSIPHLQHNSDGAFQYAQYLIAQRAHELKGARSCRRAARYLRRAAHQNHPGAYHALAQLEFATALYDEALEDLKEADFLGCPEASYQLGEIYRLGFRGRVASRVVFKVTMNLETAKQYYGRAGSRGMVRLGDLESDPLWYERAVGQSDGEAEYALGCLREDVMWFVRSAEAGYSPAKYRLGCHYLAEGDVGRGLTVLEEEATNGNVLAIKALARHWETTDVALSFAYWRRAELLNDPEALEFIADCFEHGKMDQSVCMAEADKYRRRAREAREEAVEMQQSVLGFKSDYSDEKAT
ncbi:MAG: hypothetical protein EXX96DRAFT_580821 [Benjaminiella poitrasii]|nr:MAG: hypothetical protein EXX96DRAFT_580821 [Benjaminiella poitrasii]